MTFPPGEFWAHKVEPVGYHDIGGHPVFKMGMQEVRGRWYLYAAHLWRPGWSILDVTEPARPELLRYIKGPANTWTIQIQVASGLMITGLEQIAPGWGGQDGAPCEEGVQIWDVREPAEPRPVGRWRTGGSGTHRNFYDGGRYLHCSAAMPGFRSHIYQIVDLDDPERPRAAGRWWVPGQWEAGGESGMAPGTFLHQAYVEGERAHLAFSAAGYFILDIADPERPRPVGGLSFSPPFQPFIALHTAMPLPGRKLVSLNSEAIRESCDEPLGFAGLADLADESAPRLVSLFPLPAPPPGYPHRNFCEAGGRFGPHNQQQPQGNPALQPVGDLIYLTYFNAGLRVIDIADPLLPREVGWFVPPAPAERRGLLPSKLVPQSEDVIVDARGFAYVSDKNHGIYVLRYSG